MSVVAVTGSKGAPGATTAAVALATAWPGEERAVVVEADPDGGDIAARAGLSVEPGLASLVTACRRGHAPDTLLGHTQELACGTRVVVGPPSPDEAAAALSGAATLLPALRDARDVPVIVDCGRLAARSPALPLVLDADVLVVVVRPRLDQLQHVAARLDGLRAEGSRPVILLVGERPYQPRDVARGLDVEVVGVLPDDARGATVTSRGAAMPGSWRTPLLRAAPPVAAVLARRVADHLPAAGPTRGGVAS